MKSIIGFALFSIYLASVLPSFLESRRDTEEPVLKASKTSIAAPATAKAYRDSSGHFSFAARLNGKRVNVLVDTGASSVAINRSTAKRAGVRYGNRGTISVSTANGMVQADRAVINEVRVGNIVVRNVEALVVSDRALSSALLGMSFLKKLKQFEISGRTLKMVR